MRPRQPMRSSLSLADLVEAVDELTASPEETTEVVENLLRTRRVRLRRPRPGAMRDAVAEQLLQSGL